MTIFTPPWVSGDGKVHTLASIPGAPPKAKFVQFTGMSIAGTSRIGDANIGATQGYPLASNAGQFFPPTDTPYDLNQICYLLAEGDTGVLVC